MVEGSFRGQQEPLEDDRIRWKVTRTAENRKTARRWKGDWKTAGSSRRRQNPLKGGGIPGGQQGGLWKIAGVAGKKTGSAERRQVSLLEGVRDRWRTSQVRGIRQGPPRDSRICWKATGVAARRC
jgi:hypothetical protein